TTIDSSKLDALVSRAVGDLSAGYGGIMISQGHQLGLFEAMAGAGTLTAREVGQRANCAERYVLESHKSQVAGGYFDYHPIFQAYELVPEPALVLCDAGERAVL